MSQKGFSSVIILIVVAVLAVGTGAWYVLKDNSKTSSTPVPTVQPNLPSSQSSQTKQSTTQQPEVVSVREEVAEFELVPGKTFVLKDNLTELSLKRVHKYASMKGGVFVENGLPYVKVGNGWLEIINSATIASNGYVFQIDKISCDVQSKFREDYTYNSLESCKVRVKTTMGSSPKITVTPFKKDVSLNDRDDKLFSTTEQSQLLAVRSLGFAVGNVNREIKPWVVESVMSSLDIVTNLGVINIDLDYSNKPIIGHEKTFTLGPQQITFKILDVANINTRCDPSCRNVFDLSISVNPLTPSNGQVNILKYN